MVAPIHCCYRGCALTVWTPAATGLEVERSSATCMQCRRVALCLPHFEAVFRTQQHLRCPNCRAQAWYVCHMGSDGTLSPVMQVAVETAGGRIEARRGRSEPTPRREGSQGGTDGTKNGTDGMSGTHASEAAEPPETAENEPARPLDDWLWIPADRLPADARILDRGVIARLQPRGTALVVDGEPLPWLCPGPIRAAARAAGTGRDAIVSHAIDDTDVVSWIAPDGHRLTLAPPPGGALDRATFVDARRFVYVLRQPDGAEALWEAIIEQPARLRQRRVASLGHGVRHGVPPVVVRHREAVVALALDGSDCAPTWIQLADGRQTTLAAFGPPPRSLAGAARGRLAAWIDAAGDIRCAGAHRPLQTLGRTAGDRVSITDDGRTLAWVDADTLVVCDLRTGRKRGHRVPTPLAWFGPRTVAQG